MYKSPERETEKIFQRKEKFPKENKKILDKELTK